ncbi:MAG: hypothetical protein IID36_09115, partial [Planctomycetes bacterium]|nr:hypothetical protein [Planctomycetota bacterium]
MTGEELHRIIKRCRTANEQVYAVADAARDRAVAFRGGSSPPPDCRWLFEDGTDKHMTGVAPYVVPVEMADRSPFR